MIALIAIFTKMKTILKSINCKSMQSKTFYAKDECREDSTRKMRYLSASRNHKSLQRITLNEQTLNWQTEIMIITMIKISY